MSNFNIQRARGTLPGRAPQVRASIDVTTGGRDIARAISGLGGAMADVGMRFYLMEADTQLEKARMQADEEHVRYMLGLRDIEDTSAESNLYKKAFDASMATRRTYMPKNKLAARGYESYLTRNLAQWGSDTVHTKLDKQKDNFRGVGFELQQKAIESGDFAKYFTHLEKGRTARFDAYTDEEVAKYKQNTIDNHKRYVEAQTATAKRQYAEQLKQLREQTMSAMLADVWDGKLIDPQLVTDALREGRLDDADAKYLRDAIKSTDPPETTNEALIAIRYTIDGIAAGTETRESALKKVIEYTQQLSPTDGKSFIKEIFGVHDTKNAFWKREAWDYIERQILEVATMTGILWGSGEQRALSAKAHIAFDQAIKDAAKAKKPLEGSELLIKAHEIMLPFRRQAPPLVGGEKIPESLLALEELKKRQTIYPKILPEILEAAKKVVGKQEEILPKPKTKAEYDKLKSGTRYIDPKGIERIKK